MALKLKHKPLQNESGQAVIEYVLLIAVVVTAFVLVMQWVTDIGLAQKLTKPITGTFAATYRYGHPKAKGFEDGAPENHPRAVGGENNFRIFINPAVK